MMPVESARGAAPESALTEAKRQSTDARRRLLRAAQLIVLAMSPLAVISIVVQGKWDFQAITGFVVVMGAAVGTLLRRRDRIETSAAVFVGAVVVASAISTIVFSTTAPNAMIWLTTIVIAAATGGPRLARVCTVVAIATYLGVWAAEAMGWLVLAAPKGPAPQLMVVLQMVLVAVVVHSLSQEHENMLRAALERAQLDAKRAKQLAEEDTRRQRLEAVGRLASGVAHEFNNQLAVVMTNVARLRSPMAEAEKAEALADVDRAAEQGAEICRQLLSLTRHHEAETAAIHPATVMLRTARVVSRLRGEAFSVVVRSTGELPPIGVAAGPVAQVLLNLLLNAADAVEDSGEVVLRAESREGGLWCAVDDAGPGVPEEKRREVFEPFFTDKRGRSGTGLGLAVSQRIIADAGGWICCEDSPQGGARFCFWLPRSAVDPAVEEEIEEAPSAAPRRILLVDDNESLARSLTRILEIAGHRTRNCGTLAEARRAIGEGSDYDLIVTDAGLPDGSGADFAQECSSRGMKVLLISGYIKMRGSGIPYLQKPFAPSVLEERIQALLKSA